MQCAQAYFVNMGLTPERFRRLQHTRLRSSRVEEKGNTSTLPSGAAHAQSKPPVLLENFPNDVVYWTEQQINGEMMLSKMRAHSIATKPMSEELRRRTKRKIWDEARKAACLGNDVVAKRCSMNDCLWEKYTTVKAAGGTMTLKEVEKCIRYDLIRSELYREGDDFDSPPNPEYLKQLGDAKVKLILERLARVR